MIQLKGSSDKRVGRPPGANISDGPWEVTALGSKALASVDNISGSHGGGWGKFMGPRRLLGKLRRNLAVLLRRYSWPDGDHGSPNVCCIYLDGNHIGWNWFWQRSGGCGDGKILLAWEQCLLEIFGQGPCCFGIFGSGLTSVEDVDAPNWSPRRGHAWWPI